MIQAKVVIQVLLVKNNTGEKKNPYNYVCIYVQSILFTETDSLMIYCRRIWQHYQNVQDFFFRKRDADKLKKLKIWFDQQNSWMRNMIIKNKSDPMWRHVGLIMAQFDGLVAGYKSVAKMVGLRIKKLSIIYFLSHNFLLNTITMLKKRAIGVDVDLIFWISLDVIYKSVAKWQALLTCMIITACTGTCVLEIQ